MPAHRGHHSLDGTRISCPGLALRVASSEVSEWHTHMLLHQSAPYMLVHCRNHQLDGTRISCLGLALGIAGSL